MWPEMVFPYYSDMIHILLKYIEINRNMVDPIRNDPEYFQKWSVCTISKWQFHTLHPPWLILDVLIRTEGFIVVG